MFFSRANFAFSLLILLSGTVAFARDLQVIYSQSTERSLEREDIKEIIRARRLTWKNGQNILLIIDDLDLVSDEEFQDAFGISKTMFLDSWRIKFFSGRALSPIQVKTSDKGLSYVDDSTNALYLTFQGVNKDYAPKGIAVKPY